MSDAGVGRVYAQALFDAARDAGRVEQVRRDLGEFANAVAANAPLAGVFVNPQTPTLAKHRIVAQLAGDAEKLVRNLLLLLIDKGRFEALGEIRTELEDLAAAEAEVVEIQVTSAVDLPAEAEQALRDKLEKGLGRTVALVKTIDPEVIGGLVLRVGDRIVDASVRARIRQLRRQLETAQ